MWLVFDIGCIECGEESQVVGTYATERGAKAAKTRYLTNEPNKHGTSWGRPEWIGQHYIHIEELK